MKKIELKAIALKGENSRLQFKSDIRNVNALPGGLKKMSGKTSGKILTALVDDVNSTIPELAALIGVTEQSIERNIKNCRSRAAWVQPWGTTGR